MIRYTASSLSCRQLNWDALQQAAYAHLPRSEYRYQTCSNGPDSMRERSKYLTGTRGATCPTSGHPRLGLGKMDCRSVARCNQQLRLCQHSDTRLEFKMMGCHSAAQMVSSCNSMLRPHVLSMGEIRLESNLTTSCQDAVTSKLSITAKIQRRPRLPRTPHRNTST